MAIDFKVDSAESAFFDSDSQQMSFCQALDPVRKRAPGRAPDAMLSF